MCLSSCVFFSLAVANPVCEVIPGGKMRPRDNDDFVMPALWEHNKFDPQNALKATDDAWTNCRNLYVYYLYATVAMLMGDAGAAKTWSTQTIAM